MRNRGALLVALLLAVAAMVAVGCGGDDEGDNETTAAESTTEPQDADAESEGQTQAAAGPEVEIKMGEYYFSPSSAKAPAGASTISAPNEGQLVHELVVFKSDANPSSLPVSGGEVDEAAFEKQGAVNVGEIEDVAPGETKSAGFNLAPGSYVMICNLPGHYEQGMRGSITVK